MASSSTCHLSHSLLLLLPPRLLPGPRELAPGRRDQDPGPVRALRPHAQAGAQARQRLHQTRPEGN